MQAIILVGGEGTRLRPLTYTSPKQLLPIVGTPLLERVIDGLAGHGITEVILSLGYLPDQFIDAYPTHQVSGLPVSYAVEPEPLDTAGAIRYAANHAHVDHTFVVVNGDVLTDFDISALIKFHRERQAEGTIALHPVEDPSRYGVVASDGEGRVKSFIEKPPRDEAPSNEINAGFYVLEPSVISRIEADVRVSVERVTFPSMVDDQSLFALSDDSYWLDTGTPEAYLAAHLDILSGRRVVELETPSRDGAWQHRTAAVHDSATVTSSSIDRDCRVAAGAVVTESVLLPGAIVESGAVVRHSILGARSRVGAGSTLQATCVIGDDEVLAANSHLEDARVGGPR